MASERDRETAVVLTRAQILAEPAGPRLDAWVLERVCGWTYITFPDGPCPDVKHWTDANGTFAGASRPVSTDDGACWRWVVPALRAKGWAVVVSVNADGPVQAVLVNAPGLVVTTAHTPALALCRAAVLTTMEGEHHGD